MLLDDFDSVGQGIGSLSTFYNGQGTCPSVHLITMSLDEEPLYIETSYRMLFWSEQNHKMMHENIYLSIYSAHTKQTYKTPSFELAHFVSIELN